MTTIYTTLPIYDSVIKQDYNRTGCIMPIYTPRHRLPSWQYKTTETPGAVTRIDLVSLAGVLTNITTYFPTLSDDYALTASTYYKYDGDTLNYLLPFGTFYLKITHANSYYYYSELFTVTDIYPNLVSSLPAARSTYDTFTTSGLTITSAINIAPGGAYCGSNDSYGTFRKGETLTFITYLTLNSGELPSISILTGAGYSSNTEQLAAGLNVIDLTLTNDGSYISIIIENSAAADWATSPIYLMRSYSTDFIRIDFHDTHDLGDIVYQDGFTQSLWLNTRLNTPTHEPVLVGEEKNGIFIAEKIITKYKYRIVTYVGPVFYRALIRLPQHDTITITDEVGFSYSPDTGNIQVSPINMNYFDWGTLEIVFNDNSEFIWTKEANNLT